MRTLYIKTGIRNLILLFTGMLFMLSCIKEDVEYIGGSIPATIKVATSVAADEEMDNSIISLRIMAFERGGSIKYNTFYDATYLNANNPIIHPMVSGVYDFVFIANEMFDGTQRPALSSPVFSGSKTVSSLGEITIPASEIHESNPIPMFTQIDNVTVLPGLEGIKVNDGVTQTLWTILMKRLAVRIDITLKSQVDLTSQFKGVVFSNIPDEIPFWGNYTGLQNTTRAFTIAADPDNFEIITPPNFVWGIKIKRIILPSNTFSPENMVSRSLKMTLTLSPWNDEFPSAIIGIDEPFNYTLPPNTHFMGEGIIGPLLDLNLNAFDWDTKDLLGDINGRILNVSTLNPMISLDKPERVYFYTNQKEVSINPIGYLGASAFDVDEMFQALLEKDNIGNFYFDATIGAGYVDLVPQPSVTEPGIYVIYLNAGGLIRTLNVTISTR